MEQMIMKMRFKITLSKQGRTTHVVDGFREVLTDHMSVEEMQDVIVLEQVIEKFTGYRAHVETEYIHEFAEIPAHFSRSARLEKLGAASERDI